MNFTSVHKIIYTISVALLLHTSLFAQNTEVVPDSLSNVAIKDKGVLERINILLDDYKTYHKNKNTRREVEILEELTSIYKNVGLELDAFEYLLKLENIFNKRGDYYSRAKTNLEIGRVLIDINLYASANSYLLDVEKSFDLFDDTKLKYECLNLMGYASFKEGKYEESILWYKKSLKQLDEKKDIDEVNSLYQKIGISYQKSGNIEGGISYYKSVISNLDNTITSNVRGILNNNLGVLYSKKEDFPSAKKYFWIALKEIKSTGMYTDILAMTNINLAIVLQRMNNQDKAIFYSKKAKKLALKSDDLYLKNNINYIIANIYYYVTDYHNSLLYIDYVIDDSRNMEDVEMISKSLLFKSKIYGALDNYENERDYKSSYLHEQKKVDDKKLKYDEEQYSLIISVERIEKEELLSQKHTAEDIAKEEIENAEIEVKKTKEAKLLRDKALMLAQHEKDKATIIEIEKNSAINKSKRDSLIAVNAIVHQQMATDKSKSDSIATMLAIQKQRIAENKAYTANEILNRTYIIWILFIAIIIIVLFGFAYQRRLNNKISKERDKSDSLLLNILPSKIADELKSNSKVSPRKYDKVSVLFTDFVGFTKIAEQLSEDELIEELDKYFNVFDNIISKYNLEKIKTIGDSYMCAGGVPIPNESNEIDTVRAGLEIARYVNEDVKLKKSQGLPYWNIRIGINTGTVVAGVVGSKKFAYDIWGDTVNIASRIEANGLEGFVNISETTYNGIKHEYSCVFRGDIIVKNKGAVPMYYVESVK